MEVAKRNNIPNPWFAFIPVASYYLLGKLGFEVYSNENEKNSTFTWVMLGLSAALVLVGTDSDLTSLLNVALMVFATIAYYRIYKYLTPKYKMYTVLSFFFGGLPLYLNKNMIKVRDNEVKEADLVKEKKEMPKKDEIKKEEQEKPNFCSSCGNKLTKTAKFCPNCGKKII